MKKYKGFVRADTLLKQNKIKIIRLRGELEWDEDLVELVNRPKKFVPRIKFGRPSKTFYRLSTTEKAEKNRPKHVVNLDEEDL